MAEKMRIGELLLLRERIDPWLLSHTLQDQGATEGPRHRLVSLLVARAQLDMDDGALLLSEQLGYPAAHQRHLEQRDPSVLDLLPAPLSSRWVVLPLARARTGAIVVVARDPTPILAAALEHAMASSVVLAVTPAVQLERMLRAVHGLPASEDDAPMPSTPPTLADIGTRRIDDETPLPVRRARTVSYMFRAPPDLLRAPNVSEPLQAALLEIDRAHSAAAVERLVMSYAATRWSSALLARIDLDNRLAIGVRGHGIATGEAARVRIPLAPASMLSLARDARRFIEEGPADSLATPTQERLVHALGGRVTAAAPVIASGEVVAVLVVGAPAEPGDETGLAELDRLVDALGAAYDRYAR